MERLGILFYERLHAHGRLRRVRIELDGHLKEAPRLAVAAAGEKLLGSRVVRHRPRMDPSGPFFAEPPLHDVHELRSEPAPPGPGANPAGGVPTLTETL